MKETCIVSELRISYTCVIQLSREILGELVRHACHRARPLRDRNEFLVTVKKLPGAQDTCYSSVRCQIKRISTFHFWSFRATGFGCSQNAIRTSECINNSCFPPRTTHTYISWCSIVGDYKVECNCDIAMHACMPIATRSHHHDSRDRIAKTYFTD